MAKRDAADEPYIENYPPLRDFLRELDARCVHQLPIGNKHRPDAYVEAYQAPGASVLLWVVMRADRHGWDLMTSSPSNNIPESIEDARNRLFPAKVAPDALVEHLPISVVEMEHEKYAMVWTLSPESARAFFGAPDKAEVVVLKEAPTSERELARYVPEAKLYGVKLHVDRGRQS